MAGKIKVIIKRPDEEAGHVTWISPTLKNLQTHVNGYIETVPCTDNSVIICNEEGKIKGLMPNFLYGGTFPDIICGTVIVCGTNGEDFADVPFSLGDWKRILSAWGN